MGKLTLRMVFIVIAVAVAVFCAVHWLYHPNIIEGIPGDVDDAIFAIQREHGNCHDKAVRIADLLVDYGDTYVGFAAGAPPNWGEIHSTVWFTNAEGKEYHLETQQEIGGTGTVLATTFYKLKWKKDYEMTLEDWAVVKAEFEEFISGY